MKLQLFILGCILQSIYGSGEKAPYIASVQLDGRHLCGGSIINKRFVLTAAHCVDSLRESGAELVVGTDCLKDGGKHYKVDKSMKHPKFERGSHDNDVALIRIADSFEFNDEVQPISLSSQKISVDVEAVLTGYGTLAEAPNCLKMSKLTVHPTEKCQKFIPGMRGVCANYDNKECYGYSGSPLVRNEELIGVVNYGISCGQPVVFTEISPFHDWIQAHAQ